MGSRCRLKSKSVTGLAVAGLLVIGLVQTAVSSEFAVSGELGRGTNYTNRVEVRISVPDKHYLYADKVSVTSTNVSLKPLSIPEPVQKPDKYRGGVVGAYTQDVRFVYAITGQISPPFNITVSYQGCSDTTCFLPVSQNLSLGQAEKNDTEGTQQEKEVSPVQDRDDWQALVEQFKVAGKTTGYVRAADFTEFLDSARKQQTADRKNWQAIVEQQGWLLAAALILLGGLALNLTPCVLPMIPVNLAIIGAGTQAASRGRGWALGSLYGAGMAVVYGALGLLVVLTGARFGTLNASPWFNAVIAVIFVVLALGMFDVFHIDLSRFQSKAQVGQEKKGSLAVAFFLGGIMALLAGACVAPVVISVLLFATELYAGGNSYALILPFLLGVGMALPWPFAGAGLSFLPRPGKWMNYIKYAFGIIILGFAVYYGHLAFKLFANRRAESREQVAEVQKESLKEGWHSSLPAALSLAEQQDKPVLIDFWATWCKSCLRMENTTFENPDVIKAMKPFVKVKFQAEDPDKPEIKKVLDHFGILGLPTYVVLVPEEGRIQ